VSFGNPFFDRISRFFRFVRNRISSKMKKTRTSDLTKRQILRLTTQHRFPTWRQWKCLPRVLHSGERQIIRISLSGGFVVLLLFFGWYMITHRTEIAAPGGLYTEGLIGTPRLVNPLYANSSDVDQDLARLIYSGLFRWNPDHGLEPDLADTYQMTEDQKTYTIHIRDHATWHNGTPIRAEDVVFTIQAIQNPTYRSSLASTFHGVTVSSLNEKTVQFVLEEPFAPFLSTLTVGILPADVWRDIPPKNAPLASLNLEPIGSGPYRFEKFTVDKKGNIRSYTLIRNETFYRHPPLIERLTFKFYSDTQALVNALENRNVEGASFVPCDLENKLTNKQTIQLLRPMTSMTTTLFFNQENQPLLKDIRMRKAFALSLDRQEIINNALDGHGQPLYAPILAGMVGYDPDVEKLSQDLTAANTLLDETEFKRTTPDEIRAKIRKEKKDGQLQEVRDELVFTLSVVDQPEFIRAAETIMKQAANAGIRLNIQPVAASSFYETVIKPRAYQLLLTGTQSGLDSDPYPFWHSSQIKDPGLNLALYVNRDVDTFLEEARKTTDTKVRTEKYQAFQNLLVKDLPAIFLYQPTYTYAISTKVHNITLKQMFVPADRFVDIENWYVKTKKVMK